LTRQTRLLRELERLLPHGQWRVVQERPWYSLTFSGVQLTVTYTPAAPCGVDEVAAILRKHEFSLQDRIVADIGVEEAVGGLVVVMLVLEG
jgi:hypothetical protein